MLCTYESGDNEHRCFSNIDEIIDLHTDGISEDISIKCTAAETTDILEDLLCHDEYTLSSDFDYSLVLYNNDFAHTTLNIDPDGICSIGSICI